MSPSIEVLSYGEALVDFLPEAPGKKLRDVELFTKTSGGAPANAAIGMSRLGCKVGLLGKIGADEFGQFLYRHLEREGVDVRGVSLTEEAKTGVAFISLDENGDRSFLFFREPSADMTIRVEDIDEGVLADTAAALFGSNLLTKPPVRKATFHALGVAKAHGVFIVLDPNIRRHLWDDEETARAQVERLLGFGDLVKMNEEELEFVSGGRTIEDGRRFYAENLAPRGTSAFVLTLAERGAALFAGDREVVVDAPRVDVLDTTGAGDGFVAALLTAFVALTRADGEVSGDSLRASARSWDEARWNDVLRFACYVGSSVCTAFGATPALPHADSIPWDDFNLPHPKMA